MTTISQGMLLVATNVADEDDADFNRWYDEEHVAERVAIPGFLCGTRYRARRASRRYLGLYKTQSLQDFTRASYHAAFHHQTAWSVQNLQKMVQPLRRVCRIDAHIGLGSGAHLAVLTCSATVTASVCQQLGESLSRQPGFVSSALLTPDVPLSSPLPKEERDGGPLRQMVLIEASSEAAIESLALQAAVALPAATEFYALSWQLTAQEMMP